jgi:two-component system, cell cycle sensor histidine kinase and response regulator CckA
MSLGRILVVEDEPGLLRVLVRYLARLGYEAVAAARAGEALESFRADPTGFAAVLTDLSLPDMRGEDLVVRLRGLNPTLAVLVASGNPSALARNAAPVGARTVFLEKPFTPRMLSDALDELLGAGGGPQSS